MKTLSFGERELVALGAALGSNCLPCVEYHIPEARNAGFSDQQISEAIHLADQTRQIPARMVLDTALGNLSAPTIKPPARHAAAPQSAEADEPASVVVHEKPDPSLTATISAGSDGSCCG